MHPFPFKIPGIGSFFDEEKNCFFTDYVRTKIDTESKMSN